MFVLFITQDKAKVLNLAMYEYEHRCTLMNCYIQGRILYITYNQQVKLLGTVRDYETGT
jgi:hypothetical protein